LLLPRVAKMGFAIGSLHDFCSLESPRLTTTIVGKG